MNRLAPLAYGATAAGVALLTAHEALAPGAFLYGRATANMAALGIAGWCLATLGPLALSLGFWRLARRVEPHWVWHLLFMPSAIAAVRAGSSMLFYAAHGTPSDNGSLLEFSTLIPAVSFLALTLLVHAAALAAQGVATVRRRAAR